MKNQIIVDSCCDMLPEMKTEMGIISIPLTMLLGNREFRDDEFLDVFNFMKEAQDFTGKTGSASPAPFLYQEAIENAENAYIVTLSSKLSGSYSNAVIGSREASENGMVTAHVFDSKSASAGETLVAIKLHELIRAGCVKEQIIQILTHFIDNMKTYFVLENYEHLQKNGRLSKIAGRLIKTLNIKLIMGSDSNGEIALFEKCRGTKAMITQLLSLIQKSKKNTQDENIVISHCNNPSLANELKLLIQKQFSFKQIYVVPTGGLSSLYAANRGIVLAF